MSAAEASVSQTVSVGKQVTFTVTADGNPAPGFQWHKNGQAIANATSNTLTLSSVTLADSGTYSALATNTAGSALSNDAVLLVTEATTIAPAFSTQPASLTAETASTVTFTAAATGTPEPALQWFHNGVAIQNATSTTLTRSNITAADAGSYTVTATNTAGSVTSNAATLTVVAAGTPVGTAPTFTTHPVNQTAAPLSSVTFTVAVAGSPTPTVQWYRDGITFGGWTGTTLTLAGISTNDVGSYTAVATNSAGTVTSNAATLTVATGAPSGPILEAPVITTQPQSQTVTESSSVTFTVAATGSPAPAFQWYRNGVTIAGATSATLSLSSVSLNDGGSFTVSATNSAGTVLSNAAILTVAAASTPSTTAPLITTQPVSQTAAPLSTVTFTIAATGSPEPTIEWFRDGVTFAGWTGSTLTLSGISANDVGSYVAVATNSAGKATSIPATLTIGTGSTPPPAPPATPTAIAPVITTQPLSQTAAHRSTVTFTVAASGTPEPTIQWFRNGITFAGWTGSTLTLQGLTNNDAGTYTAVATNSAGSATSNGAVLTVTKQRANALSDDFATTDEAPIAVSSDSRLVNLSVRSVAGTGSDSLILGFVVSGSDTQSLLIRGSGPALSAFGVSGVLADPTLSLYSASGLVAANDDWHASTEATQIAPTGARAGAFTLAESSRDSALLTTLAAGSYTGQVSGKDAQSGVALIELYDVGATASARLVNVSVRTIVKGNAEAPVIGFSVSGTEPKKLLVRAVGPSLAAFGVAGVVANPQLEIYEGSTRVAQNDDWSATAGLETAFGSVGAFPFASAASQDAAIVFTAAPGTYTAVVSGVNNASGTVLLEVYELP